MSNFKVARWIPSYLRWYRFAFGPRLTADRAPGPDRAGPRDTQKRSRQVMEKVLVSGSAGFIGGYVVEELLQRGYAVVGVDNFSKYGQVSKSYDDHPRYQLVEGDARDVELMTRLLSDCDHFIAGAAMIGGISYFHTYAYDLLATNERIIAVVLRRGHRGPPRRPAAQGHLPVLLDGLRERDRLAVLRGPAAGDPAAAVVLRLPEAGRGVLRPGRLGPVPAAVHDRPPVQLRGHRREPGPGRRGDPVRATSGWP